MSNDDTYVALPRDRDTLCLTPTGTPQFEYEKHPQHGEILSIVFTDPNAGPCLLAMSPSMANTVAKHVQSMVDSLDELRWRYDFANEPRKEN